jgi:hypothetical protein
LRDALEQVNHPLLNQLKEPIKSLIEISNKLSMNVNRGIDEAITEPERRILRVQRIQFLNIFYRCMEIYNPLYQQYSLLNQKDLVNINNSLKDKPGGLDLTGRLIMPIQRATRYKLLVDGIQTEGTHLDEQTLAECDQVRKVVSQKTIEMNEALKSPPPPPKVEEGYQFGDYTRNFFGGFWNNENRDQQAVIKTSTTPSSIN